ncbi:MAG: lytic transglycosylase domain-containing protein [Maritimibacter sp.]|nr:lytic transglycosylase domain-containing protein [Maritimibacter sp.]
MSNISRRFLIAALPALALSACSGGGPLIATKSPRARLARGEPALHPNETPELRALINKWADYYAVPRDLVQAQILRESGHRAEARNGPYYGLMQIHPRTASTMGFSGPDSALLDPDVNLQYGVKYLRGAWLVSGGDRTEAMRWYAKGYYYEAKRKGLLAETGLI